MSEPTQTEALRRDVLAGLQAQPPSIPSKYLYDARGSELFERITSIPEYYVTRSDLALHEAHLPEIAARIGPGAHIIELGSGAGVKTRRLLASLEAPRAYTPIEISAAALARSVPALTAAFPQIELRPLQADYTQPIDADSLRLDPPARRRIVYFPGSTIGNLDHDQVPAFLQRLGHIAGAAGAVLVGADLIKPARRLVAAYDDAEGVTAAFNLNLLVRLERELGAEVEINAFAHQARWVESDKRIEMHLVARRQTTIVIDGHRFEFARGDSIHTESSHKYTIESFQQLARRAGLRSEQVWLDPDGLFSMHWLSPAGGTPPESTGLQAQETS